MPPLLRPRLVCHYCGLRSKRKETDGRRFKCESCEAVNFLDENGEIADVPPTETESPRQYARPGAYAYSQSLEADVFCSTCVKNQQLLTEALSNYLPPPDDPFYPQYEASLPAYRQNLEDRYPQVCPQCESKVRQRILQAGYYAKSDHLRRMMDRSRARQIANRWGWRSMILRAGGLGYCASIVAQLCWHAMGALSEDGTRVGGASYTGCMVQCLKHQRPPAACAALFASTTGMAIVVGLLCIWWNPQWYRKLDAREGRLIGLKKYYNLQVLLLLLRLGSWIWLREPTTSGMSRLHQRGTHSVFLVLELMLLAYSLVGVVKIDSTPLVNWQASPAPLLSKRQYNPPDRPSTQLSSPPSSRPDIANAQPFSVSNLASSTGPSYGTWRPPTPPQDDPNAMEWEPTSNLQIKPRAVQPKRVYQQSPFHGTLPPLPTNRLLHPKASTLPEPRQAIGVPPGFFDGSLRPGTASRKETSPAQLTGLAPPKFFPQSDREAETGLEGMFSSVFSLNRDPMEVRERSRLDSTQHQTRTAFASAQNAVGTSTTSFRIVHGISGTVSFISLLTWIFMSYLSASFPLIRLVITTVTAMIPVTDVMLTVLTPGAQKRIGELSGFLVEFCTLLLFGWNRAYGGPLDTEKCDLAIAGVLSILCWQEIFLCFADTAEDGRDLRARPEDRHFTLASEEPMKPSLADTRHQVQPEEPSMVRDPPSWPAQSSTNAFSPRLRSNSIESTATDVSTASTVTTSGWKTPRRQERGPSQSPGFSLGSLALDDGRFPTSSRAFGAAQRRSNRRGAF